MATSLRERKVVTVLFADLVGFTARSEELDPEDVDAFLGPYHQRLRSELERFGGTVEKFIGDAVMALFGAPASHEDDPERAVRAALAIRDWAREQSDAQVRVAVNTGEALINLGARADLGEGMAAGDVVNTTARLQSAAPVNGVLVGETTYRATRHVIDYRVAEPVHAKGKAAPINVWEAESPRARVGSEAVSRRAPLVGRDRELDQLIGAFERVREERSAQFVTIVGVPGIGKSRLVAELLDHAEALPDLVYWRHGRCLPYGEPVTFWALAEIVKAQAGVAENDAPAEVERKLHQTVVDVVPEEERAWVEVNLQPLLGLGDASEDAAAAWRRFLETLAEQRPLVLLFEDLHWADDALLDFIDDLPDWSEDFPILVLCTARPELLTRRPGWGGGKRNAVTISLAALGEQETAKLILALLDRSVLPAETQTALLLRAGGNPLYAEQFVRMLDERGGIEGELPENVQAIIAARLDALPSAEKSLLQDAAVVGKQFWTGSLAAMSDTDAVNIELHLRSLARKDLVRRERRATVEGEGEYAFNHILVQNVAYGQIPRGARGEKHRRVAAWIESLGGSSDRAELLAHHYGSALELLRAAGSDLGDLPRLARSALRAAGGRALALSAFPASARWFDAAATIREEPDPDRPRALLQHALALHALLDERRFELLDEARTSLLETDDIDGACEAGVAIAEAWWWSGDRDRCAAYLDEASALARERGSPRATAIVLSQVARFTTLRGNHQVAIETALESLRLAEQLDLDYLCAKNLITLGTARGYMPDGDLDSAIDDVRRGIELAQNSGHFDQLSRGLINLASLLESAGRLDETRLRLAEAHQLARTRGHSAGIRFMEGNLIEDALMRGAWADAERMAEAFLMESEKKPHFLDAIAHVAKSMSRLARDEPEPAVLHIEEAVVVARKVGDPQMVIPTLAAAALIYSELDAPERAVGYLIELQPGIRISSVPSAFFAAMRCGYGSEWRSRTEALLSDTPWDAAAEAVLAGRWWDASEMYDRIGATSFAALAALRAAQEAVADGNRGDADPMLSRALTFYRSTGARRYVREGERLLAATA